MLTTTPLPSIRLDDDVIDVWACPIQPTDCQIAEFIKILSPDERMRAGRFRFEHLRRSFIFTRGTLRVLLGRYLSSAPEEIPFSYGPQGKPAIGTDTLVRFNISHSGDIVLLAFAREYDIGVDIERIRPLPDMDDLVQRFFSSAERSQIGSLPREQRERAFFACWTRKEAYLKALGNGLSTRLDTFCVTLTPTESARLVHINGEIHAAQAWTLQELTLMSDYAAAIAYRQAPRALRFRSLDELATL
jgi:4'-phosphopantetheinyl transferase